MDPTNWAKRDREGPRRRPVPRERHASVPEWSRGSAQRTEHEQLISPPETVSLRRDLCHLAPGVAAVCGTESAVFRLIARAVYGPVTDPIGSLRALRLARFAVDQLPEAARRRIATWPATPTQQHTALIVQDDPAAAQAAARVLREAGYRIVRVTDGPAAIAAIHQETPSIAVADVLLPAVSGIDGVALTLSLLDWGIPVIVLCSIRVTPSEPDIAFLPRTFGRTDLLATVSRLTSDAPSDHVR